MVSIGSECDANELQWVPKSVMWEAALWAYAFSILLTAPASTAPSPPPGFPWSDQPSRSPSHISFSAVLPAGETQTHRKGHWHHPTRVRAERLQTGDKKYWGLQGECGE